MRVAMYYNNSDVRLEEAPVPEIGPDEMLVRPMACGICGSDVLEWYRIRKAPIVLGHELSAEVADTGANVSRFKPGDRVVVSHHVPCNTCRYCLAGNHTVCETLHTTSFDPGGFAELVRVPSINVDRGVFLMPDEMSWETGSFAEPLACVVRGQRMAGFKPAQSVLILGSGVSGLLHIMLARASGAAEIIATDVSEYKRLRAGESGSDLVLDAGDDVPGRVREFLGGRGADLVIVCTGAFAAFRQALESVDRAGTVLCFACTEPGVDLPVPINEFWRNSVKVMSSYANSPGDLEIAMDLMRLGRVDVESLITHRFGLAETGKGFSLMAGSSESLKVIVEPQE